MSGYDKFSLLFNLAVGKDQESGGFWEAFEDFAKEQVDDRLDNEYANRVFAALRTTEALVEVAAWCTKYTDNTFEAFSLSWMDNKVAYDISVDLDILNDVVTVIAYATSCTTYSRKAYNRRPATPPVVEDSVSVEEVLQQVDQVLASYDMEVPF